MGKISVYDVFKSVEAWPVGEVLNHSYRNTFMATDDAHKLKEQSQALFDYGTTIVLMMRSSLRQFP